MNLKTILNINEIRKGIRSDLEDHLNKPISLNNAIAKTIALNKNITSVEATDSDNNVYDFECTLHFDKNVNKYLLESRLFSKINGAMINGYLAVVNSDLSIDNTRYNDVWDSFSWKLLTN